VEVNGSPDYTSNRSATQKIEIIGDINASHTSPIGLSPFEVGSNIVFQGKLLDDCQQNLTAANVTFQFTTATTQIIHRPLINLTSLGTEGYANNLTLAYDTSTNDSITSANITSDGTTTSDFALVNFTFKINATLTQAVLYTVTSKNGSQGAGAIYIYNFTRDEFYLFVEPEWTTPEANETKLETANGQINSTGHIIIQANATGDGAEIKTILLYDIYIGTESYHTCEATINATGNIYSCIFDTTGKEVGDYNITMVGYKDSHNNNTNFTENAFKITSTPVLENATVSIESDGWGIERQFTVNVTDNSGDTVTVTAWETLVAPENYVKFGEITCTSCNDVVLTFNRSYTCDEIGTRKFKINSTDTEGNSDTTTGTDYSDDDEFTIEKDNIRINLSSGNESNGTIQRFTQLTVNVYDLDNQTNLLAENATVTFNVTKLYPDLTFTIVGTNKTNTTGHARFNFLPDDTYNRTKQEWQAYTDVQTCYLLNQTDKFNVTTLTNIPRLTNESVAPISGGWGIERFFNVTVNDSHDNATVYLLEATSLSGPWTLLDQKQYNSSNNLEYNT